MCTHARSRVLGIFIFIMLIDSRLLDNSIRRTHSLQACTPISCVRSNFVCRCSASGALVEISIKKDRDWVISFADGITAQMPDSMGNVAIAIALDALPGATTCWSDHLMYRYS